MADCGNGPLANTFPHFPEKVDFTIAKNTTEARRQAQPLPGWQLRALKQRSGGPAPV